MFLSAWYRYTRLLFAGPKDFLGESTAVPGNTRKLKLSISMARSTGPSPPGLLLLKDMAAYSISNSFWSGLNLVKSLGGQVKWILPLDISTVPSCSHWRLAGGNRGIQPWARSVLALSERVSCGCSADSAGSVAVMGVAVHSVGMMGAGVRRPTGSIGKVAGGMVERGFMERSSFRQIFFLLGSSDLAGLGVLRVAILAGDGMDSISDSAKSSNSGSVV